MNLIRFKRTLIFLKRAHELLEEKREILLVEINRRIHELIKLKSEVNNLLQNAMNLLNRATIIIGSREMDAISQSPRIVYEIEVSKRKLMGVSVPSISFSKEEKPVSYNISQPTILIDLFIEAMDKSMPLLVKLAELETIIIRLLEEVKKTQQRINALEQVLIPHYQHLIAFISSVLEETEREEFVRVKKLKNIWMRRARL
ncbi:MAG: V-type ATP synthase subunit D [Candidatus Methanomethyliaceae archaeon]|nr:V-type ATP synthase subunit D [Candidatus Methanomethyliaceae archaeon]MDW7970929.1 V-type ATP synthase subunit D [Nitrososphaerota archaeon]